MSGITLETVQWSTLLDIDDVEPVNNEDEAVLEEIRQVLLRHKKTSRFGICLLHKHFDITEDEVAVEYTDPEQRISKVVVEKKTDHTMNSVQTMWRFAPGGVSLGTVCVARCASGGMTHRTVHERRSV